MCMEGEEHRPQDRALRDTAEEFDRIGFSVVYTVWNMYAT